MDHMDEQQQEIMFNAPKNVKEHYANKFIMKKLLKIDSPEMDEWIKHHDKKFTKGPQLGRLNRILQSYLK